MYGISTISKDDGVTLVSVKNPPNEPGVAYRVFSALTEANIDVDIIIQSASVGRSTDIVFTVRDNDAKGAEQSLSECFSASPDTEVTLDSCVSKISVSGEGMQGKPGVAAKVFKCLWDADVRVINTSTSEIKISMIVPGDMGRRAMDALVAKFELKL